MKRDRNNCCVIKVVNLILSLEDKVILVENGLLTSINTGDLDRLIDKSTFQFWQNLCNFPPIFRLKLSFVLIIFSLSSTYLLNVNICILNLFFNDAPIEEALGTKRFLSLSIYLYLSNYLSICLLPVSILAS